MQGKEGFFRQLGEGINQLMQTSSDGLVEVARMLNALAQGGLSERITSDFMGTFGQSTAVSVFKLDSGHASLPATRYLD